MTDILASSYIKKLTKHIIKNNSTVFENRDGLQFTGNVTISDDSGNNNTVVNIPITDLSGYIPNTRKVNSKILSGDITLNASDIGLGNVTNDAQVKKITSSGTDNLVTFGATTGDTIKDSGILASNLVTLAGMQTIQNKTYADSTDSTKKFNYNVTGIATGNTRTITIPDKSGTMALTSNPANVPLWVLTNSYNKYDLVTYTDGYIYQANSAIPSNTVWIIGTIGVTWKKVVPINDVSASNYIDIGNVRMQWGNGGSGGNANGEVTLTFPAPFANTGYTFTGTIRGGGATYLYTLFQGVRTATTINILKKWQQMATSGSSSSETIDWIAIGLKP